MTTPLHIRDGDYRIRSDNSSTGDYLAYKPDGSTTLVAANSVNNAQIWSISQINEGTHRIVARNGNLNASLSIEDANKLVCVPNGTHAAWTIEPRGGNSYVIGSAGSTMAIYFTRLRVSVFPRNNSANQRWFLDRVGGDESLIASAGGSAIAMASLSVTGGSVYTCAKNADTARKFYFGTRPLTADDLRSYASVQLETDAHNQGWADDPSDGLHSWFEIAILQSVPKTGRSATKHIKKSGKTPLTWRSHVLPLQEDYVQQAGIVFERTHSLWANLEVGDVIGVLACVKFAMWSCEARRGELIFQRKLA